MDFGGRSNFEQTFKSRTCFLLSSFSSRFGSRYITRTGIWIWQWQMPLNLRCNLINGHPNFLEGTTGGPPNSCKFVDFRECEIDRLVKSLLSNLIIFMFPIQNWILSRLIPYILDMELAFWVLLHYLYYYLR